MLKSYQALYENGHVIWLEEQPPIQSAHIIVTVLEESVPKHFDRQNSQALQLATLGGTQPNLQSIPRRSPSDLLMLTC